MHAHFKLFQMCTDFFYCYCCYVVRQTAYIFLCEANDDEKKRRLMDFCSLFCSPHRRNALLAIMHQKKIIIIMRMS